MALFIAQLNHDVKGTSRSLASPGAFHHPLEALIPSDRGM
jgi:hypothetical protein